MTAGMPTLRLKWPANAVVIKTRLSVPKYDIDSFFLPAKIQKKTNYKINYICHYTQIVISLARYCGRESGDENVLRILEVARFDPASQENAVSGFKNSCRLPLHFSFTNDLGTLASAFDSKKEDYSRNFRE